MVTTIRMTKENANEESKFGGVGLLERTPATYEEFTNPVNTGESLEEAKLRMQRNLEKLLNYDKVEEVSEVTEETVDAISSTVSDLGATYTASDDDIRPTSTTMQFGSDDKETVFKDMERQQEVSENKYHLTLKGKIAAVVYSVAVAIIFALIIINTGVLSSLGALATSKTETLSEKQQQVQELYNEIDRVSSDEHVIEVAESELEMVWGK